MSSKTPYIVGGVVLAAGAYMIYAKRKADAAAAVPAQGGAAQGGVAPALPAGTFSLPTADAIAAISKLLAPANAAPAAQRSGLNESALGDSTGDSSALSDGATPLYMKVGGIYALTSTGIAVTRNHLANMKAGKASFMDGVAGWVFAPENTGATYDELLRASMGSGNSVLMMLEELKGSLSDVKHPYRITMPTGNLADYLTKSVSGVPNSDMWVIVA